MMTVVEESCRNSTIGTAILLFFFRYSILSVYEVQKVSNTFVKLDVSGNIRSKNRGNLI